MIVLFLGGSALLLSHYKVKDGNVIHGEVVNGAWTLTYRNGRYYADGHPVQYTTATQRVVEVPDSMSGMGYNAIILSWAEDQL